MKWKVSSKGFRNQGSRLETDGGGAGMERSPGMENVVPDDLQGRNATKLW